MPVESLPERPGDGGEGPALYTAIGRLDRALREPLVLRYLMGYDEKETAGILGLSLTTAKGRIRRKLYSLESANPLAVMPNGLRAGLKLADFKAVLGEPRNGAAGEYAWGVGSDNNVFAAVEDGIVKSVRLSLVE